MRNHEDVLRQLRAAGLLVDSLRVGPTERGNPWRCRVEGDREKRGWYIVHEVTGKDGKPLLVGSYGVWRGGDSGAIKIEIAKDAISDEQAAAVRTRLRDDRKRAEAQQAVAQAKAARRAESAWQKCSPTGDADYLKAKGVAAHGVRFSPSGAVVVPVLDAAGKIHGLQVIRTADQARKRKREAKEFWPAGLAKKGHFHLIGMPQQLVLLAEGYATGASAHEATGLPVAIAFDAGNLGPVATALRARYKTARILVLADDDAGGKCRACGERVWLPDYPVSCPACAAEHRIVNAGVNAASSTAIAVRDCAWVAPAFATGDARRAAYLERGTKVTDFNDLHHAEGLHLVRTQIEGQLLALGWTRADPSARGPSSPKGEGAAPLKPLQSMDELLNRFVLVYGQGGVVFDREEHMLLKLSDMRDACIRKDIHRAWSEHPDRGIVRAEEVDFDPTGRKAGITCNLWAGWPTKPRRGSCDRLLEMLWHMCSGEKRSTELYEWVVRWLAYPIQHPGAKMRSCVVVHGPQGTGKNLFFEAYMAIFGKYGRMLDQSALEDKFNDWASRKLFLLADEVVARTEAHHVKNMLKGLITGERVRINPKNMSAHEESNHCNFVFLSNEAMPLVLEEDDRRHAVIWTPAKLGPEFYTALVEEIAAGGAEALHEYLLHLPIGDGFGVGSQPPMTDAKRALIGLSVDSPLRWHDELMSGEIPGLAARPAPSKEWYEAYKIWCGREGQRAAPCPKFVHQLQRKRGVRVERKRYITVLGEQGPHGFLILGDKPEDGRTEAGWLGDCTAAFRHQLDDYRGKA